METRDNNDIKLISRIIQKVDQMDARYVDSESDHIFKYQPFLISLLLGYSKDLNPEELEEVNKLIFLVWEYFKEEPKIKKTKLTVRQFERMADKNLDSIKHFDDATGLKEKRQSVEANIDPLYSKSLLAAIFLRFDTQAPLSKMELSNKAVVMIGFKSLIECYDKIKNS